MIQLGTKRSDNNEKRYWVLMDSTVLSLMDSIALSLMDSTSLSMSKPKASVTKSATKASAEYSSLEHASHS